jgi:cell division protein FtsI (penicillin-binding protein 3)
VACTLAVWMLAIGVRLVYLQTSQHIWLLTRARAQQQDTVETSPIRGVVLDRHENELARSVDTESFWAVPGQIGNVEEVSAKLAPLAGIDAGTLASNLREAQAKNKKFAWIARKLDADRAEKISALNIEGVYSLKESKRQYPNGALAAHVLGFVGLDEVGLAGVERSYNEQIRGEGGKVLVETDAHGHPYSSFETQSRPGETVVLTIDRSIQYETEHALVSAVERAHAKSGSAIVLDPHTGEILALANAPSFDPNNPNAASEQARINQALQNIYEPGSTFKIIAYSAAIEKGAKPTDKIDCQMGSITIAGRLVHDHHPFGTLTLTEALAKSSNVAAIKLGIRVGDDSMYDFMTRYGFGCKTGVELQGETSGLVRNVKKWLPSSIGSIAIGQEVGVTPLQMAAAFGTLANDGVRIAPHLVREIRAADGSVVYSATPEQHKVVSAETARTMRHMLEEVTLNGTAKKAQLDGYTAAGKTGTAQKIDPKTKTYSKTKFIGSFVGFAPVENPAVVIIVVIDEPAAGSYHGGEVAAPVFNEIAEQILPGLNITPDSELKSAPLPGLLAQWMLNPAYLTRLRAEQEREREERDATLPQVVQGDGRMTQVVYTAATKRAVLMPDLRGRSVRDAARVCSQLGLQLEAQGEGRALKQYPQAGVEVETGQTVRIDFGRSE